jgi:hypothetical protein
MDLEDARFALGQLDRQLGLDAEVVAHQRNRPQQVGSHRLVAGLHVGEVEVGDQVAEQREQPVADGVAEVEHAPVVGREEARAEHRVRPLAHEGQHQLLELCGVVFEGRVVEHAHLAAAMLLRQLAQDLAAAVAGAVVDGDQIEPPDDRALHGEDAAHRFPDEILLVEDRHHDGQMDGHAGADLRVSLSHRPLGWAPEPVPTR